MEGDRQIKCGFCHQGAEVESICGKLHYDNKDTAAHHKCMQYSADLVQYKFDNFGGFKIDKVEKEIKRGKRLKCSICKLDKSRHKKWTGASAGCAISNCSKTFHFYCAKLDDVAVTKRMEVKYLKENSTVVMYRVFCGEAHYEQFKMNKGALKNQQKQLRENCSDEEEVSGDEEQNKDVLPDSVNTQLDDDILMISQLSPGPQQEEEDNNSDRDEVSADNNSDRDEASADNNSDRDEASADNNSDRDEASADNNRNNSRVKQTGKSRLKKNKKLTRISKGKNVTETRKRNSSQFSKDQTEEEEEERNESSGVSDDQQSFQYESSESELEDPFSRKSADASVKSVKGKRGKDLFDNSVNQTGDGDNRKLDAEEDLNRNNVKGAEKLAREGKMRAGRKTKDNESGVLKGKQEITKQQRTPATRNSNKNSETPKQKISETPKRKNNETPKQKASPIAKSNGRGNNQKLVGQQRIITQAELHVASSPSSVEEINMEDCGTSNDQDHSSDEEAAALMNDNLPTSPVQSGGNSSLPVDESSVSELAEMKFPDCALAITSTTKIWPSRKNIIIQKAKEVFGVQDVALWTQSDSFSDQLTDNHLPHFIKIITNMVREKRFKNLGNLLTECSFQHTHMESIKHLLELPIGIVDKIRDSLLTEVETQSLNDEVILFMDTKLSTLYLKLNNTVDRVCMIRNKLLPDAKKSLACLYEWTKNTESSVLPKQADFGMELEIINSWMKNEGWNECESQSYPSDDILLAARENWVIKELIRCHKENTSNQNSQKKLIFVKAMDEMVNCSKYLQKLLLSNTNNEKVLIISHITPPITRKFFLSTDEAEGAEVRVMSAFKPSTEKGISTIVISVKYPNGQQRNTGLGVMTAREDEITVCSEDQDVVKNRKRKSVSPRTSTPRPKSKRIN